MEEVMDAIQLLKDKLNGKTYGEIARENGVSRQRIQQILSPVKVVREFIIQKYHGNCAKCGQAVGTRGHIHHRALIENYQDINNLELLCTSCHIKSHNPPNGIYKTCTFCNKKFTGQSMPVRERRNQSGLFFCSKICQGKWIGREYGFGSIIRG